MIDPLPLAVDGSGGGQDDLVRADLVAHEGVEHPGGTDDVDARVAGGLGEGLTGTGLGGQVHDDVRSGLGQSTVPVLRRRHVQSVQLHALVELGGAFLGRVDLRVHVVQGHDAVEGVRQVARDGAADESGTTCDEAGTGHEGLPWVVESGQRGAHGAHRDLTTILSAAMADRAGRCRCLRHADGLHATLSGRRRLSALGLGHLGAPAHAFEGLGDEGDDNISDLHQRH